MCAHIGFSRTQTEFGRLCGPLRSMMPRRGGLAAVQCGIVGRTVGQSRAHEVQIFRLQMPVVVM